jgi:hypothetical protein
MSPVKAGSSLETGEARGERSKGSTYRHVVAIGGGSGCCCVVQSAAAIVICRGRRMRSRAHVPGGIAQFAACASRRALVVGVGHPRSTECCDCRGRSLRAPDADDERVSFRCAVV